MNNIDVTRFRVTRSGYQRIDHHEVQNGEVLASVLTDTAQVIAKNNEPRQAWSFSKFSAGTMSGETWVSARGVVLEYLWTGDDDAARSDRLQEVVDGAERSNLAYYVLDTETRTGERTISVVYPLSQSVDVRRYVRIASVLANRIGVYGAASGVKSHTHLVHVRPDTVVEYRDGLLLDPEGFIRLTKNEAQNLDPQQWERSRPAAPFRAVQPPANIAVDDGLFSWS